MGEKIKTISNFNIKGIDFEIELNSTSSESGEDEIHIQSNSSRIEMTKSEYYELSTAIMLAAENLKKLKNK